MTTETPSVTDVSALYEQGCKEKALGNIRAAYATFAQCVRLNPDVSAYHLNLAFMACAIMLESECLREQATLHAQKAAELNPKELGNWIGLGEIALNCNKFNESIPAFEQAISMDKNNARLYGLCGFAYAKLNKVPQAMAMYQKAVEIDPELGDIHFLLSCLFTGDNFNPERQAYHGERGFTAKKPAKLSIESCWNAAHGFLNLGIYNKGWQYFEARHNPNVTNTGQNLPARRFDKPLWKGEKLSPDGNRKAVVRVHHEMGLGDTFAMLRFLPIMQREYGVDIILESLASILPLAQTNWRTMTHILYGDPDCPNFDYHLPMMSLPHVLGITSQTVPFEGGYIVADPKKIEEWRDKLALSPNVKKVGLCWAAGKRSYNAENNETFRRKSLPFDYVKAWLDAKCEKLNFVSLQVDNDEQFPNPGIKDFSDTAAIISLLDAVISIDSAVANLVGAMGKNLWLPDRHDHCWRWSDIQTPWYPTAKIFRQKRPDDWFPVIIEITDELVKLAC